MLHYNNNNNIYNDYFRGVPLPKCSKKIKVASAQCKSFFLESKKCEFQSYMF